MSFDLPPACKEEINKILKCLNANKATGPDRVPLKFIKLSANVVDKYLTSIINCGILRSYFCNGAKIAQFRPISKKKTGKMREITIQ